MRLFEREKTMTIKEFMDEQRTKEQNIKKSTKVLDLVGKNINEYIKEHKNGLVVATGAGAFMGGIVGAVICPATYILADKAGDEIRKYAPDKFNEKVDSFYKKSGELAGIIIDKELELLDMIKNKIK